MKKFIALIVVLLLAGILAAFLFDIGRTTVRMPDATSSAAVVTNGLALSSPADNATVTSPIRVSGTVENGNWFFEGSFPISLVDASGDVLATGTAQALGDWATDTPVGFTAVIAYPAESVPEHALLILKNDNPSGDPARDLYRFVPLILK